LIKIEDGSEQKKKWNCIVDQVIEIGMNKGTRDDADQTAEPAGKNSKIIKINAISNLVDKYKPDEKKDNSRRYQAQDEPFIFKVWVFGQV
jgi:hypothetical protein